MLRAGLAPVCDACVARVQAQSLTLCGQCGEALDMEGVRYAGQFPVEGLLCSRCRMVPPEFERAVLAEALLLQRLGDARAQGAGLGPGDRSAVTA